MNGSSCRTNARVADGSVPKRAYCGHCTGSESSCGKAALGGLELVIQVPHQVIQRPRDGQWLQYIYLESQDG